MRTERQVLENIKKENTLDVYTIIQELTNEITQRIDEEVGKLGVEDETASRIAYSVAKGISENLVSISGE